MTKSIFTIGAAEFTIPWWTIRQQCGTRQDHLVQGYDHMLPKINDEVQLVDW